MIQSRDHAPGNLLEPSSSAPDWDEWRDRETHTTNAKLLASASCTDENTPSKCRQA